MRPLEVISLPLIKLVLIAHSCSSRVKSGSSLGPGNEPEPGRTWAKEGDSQGEGQAHPHASPCPPDSAPPAGGTKGPAVGLAVLERPEAPGAQHPTHGVKSSRRDKRKERGLRAKGNPVLGRMPSDRQVLGPSIPASLLGHIGAGNVFFPRGRRG